MPETTETDVSEGLACCETVLHAMEELKDTSETNIQAAIGQTNKLREEVAEHNRMAVAKRGDDQCQQWANAHGFFALWNGIDARVVLANREVERINLSLGNNIKTFTFRLNGLKEQFATLQNTPDDVECDNCGSSGDDCTCNEDCDDCGHVNHDCRCDDMKYCQHCYEKYDSKECECYCSECGELKSDSVCKECGKCWCQSWCDDCEKCECRCTCSEESEEEATEDEEGH